MKTWLTMEALEFIKVLEPAVKEIGYSLALAGSLVHKDSNTPRKDLDLIAFPRSSGGEADPEKLRKVLETQGLSLIVSAQKVKENWQKKGSNDSKHVEVWITPDGKRVDLFLLT